MRKLSPGMRKLLLAVHISFSGILLGCTVAFVVMDIAVLTSDDPQVLAACYRIMRLLAHTSLRASTIGSIASGIVLSVLTSWGLLKFRWVVAKEALSLLTVVPALFGIYTLSIRGLERVTTEGAGAVSEAVYRADSLMLAAGIALQLVSVVALYVLSVYKPWGPTGGNRRQRLSKSEG